MHWKKSCSILIHTTDFSNAHLKHRFVSKTFSGPSYQGKYRTRSKTQKQFDKKKKRKTKGWDQTITTTINHTDFLSLTIFCQCFSCKHREMPFFSSSSQTLLVQKYDPHSFQICHPNFPEDSKSSRCSWRQTRYSALDCYKAHSSRAVLGGGEKMTNSNHENSRQQLWFLYHL